MPGAVANRTYRGWENQDYPFKFLNFMTQPLLGGGYGSCFEARYHDFTPVEQFTDAGRNLVFPPVALIDRLIELLAVFLALETANPDVKVVLLFADETPDDHHPFGNLEGKDCLLHILNPVVTLAGLGAILTKFKKKP
jgi:hypothetical protein